jgi:hypothetical protein
MMPINAIGSLGSPVLASAKSVAGLSLATVGAAVTALVLIGVTAEVVLTAALPAEPLLVLTTATTLAGVLVTLAVAALVGVGLGAGGGGAASTRVKLAPVAHASTALLALFQSITA